MQQAVTLEIRPLERPGPVDPELRREGPVPRVASAQAAGLDLRAWVESPIELPPRGRALVGCGFAMALPPGHEAQVRPRSGLAIKHGVTVLNGPGTVDADYRGEVCVILINHGEAPFTVEPGMRIAQMVVAPVAAVAVEVVAELPDSERGAGGFGSTGA